MTTTGYRFVTYTDRASRALGSLYGPGHDWHRTDPDEIPECDRCMCKAGGAVATWPCGQPGPTTLAVVSKATGRRVEEFVGHDVEALRALAVVRYPGIDTNPF